MPDDQNTTQNQISTENSIPVSPQEPTEPALENTAHSEPANAPPEALESSPNDFSVESNDIPLSNSTPVEVVNEPKTEEKQALNEPNPELVSEPVQAPEPQTAQIPVNEPLATELETKNELKIQEVKPEPVSVSSSDEVKESKPDPTPEVIPAIAVISKSKSLARELLVKARNMIQFRKRKKLNKIMTLFANQTKITNDEVEKLLHVSDATVTRYLNTLEKENKIKQSGKTGKSVFYSKL